LIVMEFASDMPNCGALGRPHGSRPSALGECGPLPSTHCTIAKVDTLTAEHRETTSPQAACDSLRDSERRPHPATANGPIAIAHCDTEGRYKFVNRHYAERRGLTPEQVVGKRIPEVVGEKAWAIFEPYVRECLAGNTIESELEIDLPHQPGGPQFLHCYYEPEWKNDKVVGLIVAITNITSLKRAEAALRESEVTFRVMFDASSVGKIEVEPGSTRFLRANAAMCEFVGYTEAELLARTVLEITHPDDRDLGRELGQRLVAGESDVFDLEKRYIRKDGKVVWARTTVNVIRDASGRPLRNIAVIQDVNARKQAEQNLYASKARLQLALDAAQLGWWEYDPVRCIFSGDTRAQEICDYAGNELRIQEFLKRVHPDDVERFSAVREAALDPVDPKPYVNEYRIMRRDGKVRWVESRGRAYFEDAEPERRLVSFVGTVQDITERKEREDREHLLLREINHRAKNMLSVVHVIAHQTAAKSPEDFIERFSERIQALSANQDLLVSNEWKGVEIKDLVCTQLAHFADLIGPRIAVHGPKLRLNPASAQAIGLALHELATNAGKYGALSTDTGRVDVRWETDGNLLAMSWTECDGPPVCEPKQCGFGSIVIEAMAEYSVDGAVDLHYAPFGVTWRLTCPAANALEPRGT
jgi:PAS domain S-box-containing protein